MSPALSLLLSLAACTLLRGTPLPPRDVRLEAQNFHVCLSWEPDPGSPSGTTYQVEWRGRNSPWTKAGACWGNSTGSSRACELYFDDIYDIYWARVRAVAGGELSEWVNSSELQPYRDTIVGPPMLSWLLQGDTVSVNVTLPLTPYRSEAGFYKPVEEVLWKLWYWLSLYEGDVLIQKVPCRRGREDAPCIFRYLKPSTRYCIWTRAANMARERSREAEQCLVTPSSPAGLAVWEKILVECISQPWALLNGQLSVAIRVPTPELEEDPFALLLPAMLPSRGPPPAEPTAPTVQLLLGESLSQDINGYCANGFGPGCHQGRDPSCTRSQLGHAVGSWVPSRPGEDGEARDEDDVLEQLVPVGLTRDSYTGDRDYRTPEMWLSLHPQLYSKCQCPALGAGSCPPLPTPGRSFSQEDPQESLSVAGHWVPLKSVKMLGTEEEDGGQILHTLQPLYGCGTEPQPGDSTLQQDNLEQAAPDVPRPCPLSPSPPDTLRATFSGYELRPLAASEP
ncbi:interleukin-20 receptor subunit alpha-like isoform x2 [Limosa lapponica baueri]|uniref:Interleukin-20 receptor subunit alpha-like isoform x2 n=1 Tax=Limosa lapponica baueri TaxID=1758121 RepID=A0A2I0U0W7_LIMLA|nr:interleukin-20 receptor subunit alpha-like isoform x2 [Limosa lapponica baueri]